MCVGGGGVKGWWFCGGEEVVFMVVMGFCEVWCGGGSITGSIRRF